MKRKFFINERILHYAQKEPSEIFREMNLGKKGMSDDKTAIYRKFYGKNDFITQKNDTIFYRLHRAFVNPFSVVLMILAVISFVTDVLLASNFSRNITSVTIILSMLLISGIIRFVQELRSRKVADKLTQLVHTSVFVYRDNIWKDCPSAELVVGDIVKLQAGEKVPADMRLIKANDFFVTQSVITGESGIIEKTSAKLSKEPVRLEDYTNIVFSGSTVTGGVGEGIVLAVGKDTVYGSFSLNDTRHKHGFDAGANSIAWVLIKFMAFLIPIVFIVSGLTKGDWLTAFLFALSVAVGLTPEMLPMVITACLAKGGYAMSKKQTIVKNINAMQSFGSMDILCVDKTGTLTGDTVLLEYYMDIIGNESQKVLDFGFLNSFYHTGVYNHLDIAVKKVRNMPTKDRYFNHLIAKYSKSDELPFDYNRKFASVLVTDNYEHDKKYLLVKGSVDEVVRRCKYIEYRGKISDFGTDGLKNVHAVVDEMLQDGMKVLAVAYKNLSTDKLLPSDEYDLTLLGYLVFFDAPKKSAASAIKKLHELKVNIKVLTGDNADITASICRRLDIAADKVISGTNLESLSEDELTVCIEKNNVFAELSPKQKMRIVEILQENSHTVGFLGDGMNDLPAMVQADVGISVDTAVESVKESADVILLKKDLNVLEKGILEGRRAFANMSKYIKITASSNFGNICSIVVASMLLPFFPMTSVQLLLLNLMYDILCLILPWDDVDEEIYRKPLEWSGHTLGRFMTFFGPISSIFDILTFAFLFFVLCPSMAGGSFAELNSFGTENTDYFVAMFHTGWFLESMWSQILILYLLRTKKLPFLQSSPSQPVILTTILGILLFTALTITPLGSVLGLVAMPPVYFSFLIVTVIVYLIVVSFAKKIYIKRYHDLT